MMIIGISGLAGSGKDTVANFLRSDFNYLSISLADPLKRMCRDAFDFSEEQLWGPSEKRNAPDLRYPRAHSWEEKGHREVSCSCCGQTTHLRMIEDDLFVPDEEETKPCHLTPRFALQRLGTDWGRVCYPNIWVGITMRTAKRLLGVELLDYSNARGLFPLGLKVPQFIRGVAIPDVRFQNEIEGIRAGGGKVIRVVRSGAGLVGATGNHASETEQAGIPDHHFDRVIINDGTLDDLREKVAMMVRAFDSV